MFGKAFVMFRDELWVVILHWNVLKHRKWLSIFEGLTRVSYKVYLAFKDWFLSKTPSPIYREGDVMVLEGEWGGLVRNLMWLGACSKMALWRHEMVHS